MAIEIYDQLIPVCSHMLTSLDRVLAKAEGDAESRSIDPHVLLNSRLAPDMWPLLRQVQVAADLAKGGASRLAGEESPKWGDEEQTFADLHARIDKTLAHLRRFTPESFAGAEERTIKLEFPNATLTFAGRDYLLTFVLPNFYFHYTTAYAILRHNGVPLTKREFLGG